MKLNLGSGSRIFEGFVNIDQSPGHGVDLVYNLDECADTRLPFEDNVVEFILLSHVLEHLKNPLPLFQEMWRISKPQAIARVSLPHHLNDDAFIDPTHQRTWHWRSFNYLSQPKYHSFDYGYEGDWQAVRVIYSTEYKPEPSITPERLFKHLNSNRNLVNEQIIDLECIKPARARDKSLMRSPEIRFHFGTIGSFPTVS